MYNGTTVSLKEILWKTMNNPLASDLSYELAAEYAVEALRLVGAPFVLEDRVSDPIKIENNKGAMPLDIIELRSIKGAVETTEGNFADVALTYGTDTFHGSCHNDCPTEATYRLDNGVITTSFKKGTILVSYKSLPMDKDGFPLIPNSQKTKLAIEYYILARFLEPLWVIGKITDKSFDYITQQRDWYMGGANTDLQLAGYDHIETIMNSINRLIVNTDAHSRFFSNMGEKERLKRFN